MKEKLDKTSEKLKAEGWAWIEGQPEGWQEQSRYHRVYPSQNGKYSKEIMAVAGCWLSLRHGGKLDISRGIVKPEDKKKLPGEKGAKTTKTPKQPGAMPDLLRRSLEAFRLQVAEVAIASAPELAYDLLVFNLASEMLGSDGNGLDIRFHHTTPIMGEVEGTPPTETLKNLHAELDLGWMKLKTETERFEAFQGLAAFDKTAILAYSVAHMLKIGLAPRPGYANAADLALAQTGKRVMDYWRPTVANYLGRITTAQLLEIAEKVVSKQWAERVKSEKKSTIAQALERAFAEPVKFSNGDQAMMARLTQWAPDGMEFTLPEPDNDKAKKPAKPKRAA